MTKNKRKSKANISNFKFAKACNKMLCTKNKKRQNVANKGVYGLSCSNEQFGQQPVS